jgi:hypothetical protein
VNTIKIPSFEKQYSNNRASILKLVGIGFPRETSSLDPKLGGVGFLVEVQDHRLQRYTFPLKEKEKRT